MRPRFGSAINAPKSRKAQRTTNNDAPFILPSYFILHFIITPTINDHHAYCSHVPAPCFSDKQALSSKKALRVNKSETASIEALTPVCPLAAGGRKLIEQRTVGPESGAGAVSRRWWPWVDCAEIVLHCRGLHTPDTRSAGKGVCHIPDTRCRQTG
jgi:hypothetical protein